MDGIKHLILDFKGEEIQNQPIVKLTNRKLGGKILHFSLGGQRRV